jgi:hypothetical protein
MTEKKIKHLTGNLILVLVSVVVALLFCEMIARAFLFNNKISKSSQYIPSEYSEIVYEYKPHLNFYSPIHETQLITNAAGYRDKEFSTEKPDNLIRIICLGDSATFGWRIRDISLTYPQQLEKKLNKKHQGRFEVYNLGVEGYNTHHEVATLKYKALKYNPDIAILTVNFGDTGHDWITVRHGKVMNNFPQPPVLGKVIPDTLHNFLINASVLYYFADLIFINATYNDDEKLIFLDDFASKNLQQMNQDLSRFYDKKRILEFKKICKKNDILPVVAIMPWFYAPIDKNSPEYPISLELENFLKEHNIIAVNLFTSVLYENTYTDLSAAQYTELLKVNPDDSHPNEKALSIYADEIKKKLLENIKI